MSAHRVFLCLLGPRGSGTFGEEDEDGSRLVHTTYAAGVSLVPGVRTRRRVETELTPRSDVEATCKLRETAPLRALRHLEERRRTRAARRRFSLETDLRRALDRDELSLAFQPLIDLGSGQVAGFEALARWAHPTRGPISPAEFIPVAEESGLILQLGRWALDAAARTAERLGRWYPVLVDAAALARADGFVGTAGSTYSSLSARRVREWRGGAVRMYEWGRKGADDH